MAPLHLIITAPLNPVLMSKEWSLGSFPKQWVVFKIILPRRKTRMQNLLHLSLSLILVFSQVTILFSNFSEEDRALPEAVQHRHDMNEYNRRYSGIPRPVSNPSCVSTVCTNFFCKLHDQA